MSGSMTIHLYRVQTQHGAIPLVDQLAMIESTPLELRSRDVAQQLIRLEFSELLDGLWFMDFTKIRFNHGPGKASVETPVQGFQMDDDDGFGEETAAVFDPVRGYIAIQYNHVGPRYGTISQYLSEYDQNQIQGYNFAVCNDLNVEAKLATKEFFRKLHFSLNFGKLTDVHREHGVSLRNVIGLENTFQAGSIEVIVRMPRGGNGLSSATARDLINFFRTVRADDEKAMPKLQVYAGNDEDAAAEILDLVHQRLSAEYHEPDLILGQDKRYTRASRHSVIQRAMRGWEQYMER